MIKDLYFDCRYIRVGHHDGISRFSAGLFTALAKLVDVTAVISDLRQLDKLPLAPSSSRSAHQHRLLNLWLPYN